jgi:branched-chain amino acid transport system permease protein
MSAALHSRAPAPWADLFKESLITAGVALLLLVPMVGMRLLDRPTGPELDPKFTQVVVAVILVFIGRFTLSLVREGRAIPALVLGLVELGAGFVVPLPTATLTALLIGGGGVLALRAVIALIAGPQDRLPKKKGEGFMDRLSAKVQRSSGWLGILGVGLAVALPLLPIADRQIIDIGILLLTYIMLGWGLNIVVGLAGLLDLGYVAFFAVGAYTYALLATGLGLSFWACLPLAGLAAAGAGILLGIPVLRLRGDYFAIVTLGFGEIIRIILLNWTDLTGGPNGISSIPRPSFFGIADFSRTSTDGVASFSEMFGIEYTPLQRIIFLYYVILALALLVNLFTIRIRRLPLGRAWEALREDDIACTSLGINATNIKLAAFAIAAMFGGIAGSFFATRQGFISPESFTFMESAMILAVVVLGGMGSQVGVVVATFLVIGLPEAFRELEQYRMLAFGMGMVAIMLWRPSGLLAHREPTILLNKRAQGAVGAEEAVR